MIIPFGRRTMNEMLDRTTRKERTIKVILTLLYLTAVFSQGKEVLLFLRVVSVEL